MKSPGSILFALMMAFSSLNAVAAPGKELSEADLAKILHRYQGIRELEAPFTQVKIFKDIPTKLRSEGHLSVKRPETLVWTIEKPSFIEVEIKGTNVTITSGKGTDRTVQNFKPSQNEKDPQARSLGAVAAWFNLEPQTLIKDYRVEPLGSGGYRFTPRDPALTPFTSLDLALTPDGRVKETVIHERSGDRLEIAFGEPKIKGGS